MTKKRSEELAIEHWEKTPLLVSAKERYALYPWLPEVGEFENHPYERVLEIGCGTGCDLLQFIQNNAIATGIDITPAHARLARERTQAEVYCADARYLPFESESFDYVYSVGVLHHIADADRMVKEIFRVLRSGGRFTVIVYARWSPFVFSRILKFGWNWKLHFENSTDPVYIKLYTKRKLERLFAPREITVTKYDHLWLVAKGRK
jgi:SAM-dependent methyltransferase